MDAARLARAVYLDAHRVRPGRWVVTGGAEPHDVTVDAGGVWRCDCADFSLRAGVGCKHVLRVRLTRADSDVIAALRELIPMPKRKRARPKAVA